MNCCKATNRAKFEYRILVVDRVNTDGGVSKYKTRKGNYYIIGAASDGNYSEITHRANFFFHDEDI